MIIHRRDRPRHKLGILDSPVAIEIQLPPRLFRVRRAHPQFLERQLELLFGDEPVVVGVELVEDGVDFRELHGTQKFGMHAMHNYSSNCDSLMCVMGNVVM